ncbi:MAG: hypothetical protein JWQ51_2761, partial [Tardiphaga sp.]|nr:hypothetical protein [Tardiphaga sp.]
MRTIIVTVIAKTGYPPGWNLTFMHEAIQSV